MQNLPAIFSFCGARPLYNAKLDGELYLSLKEKHPALCEKT